MEARYRRVVDLVELTDLLQGRGDVSGEGITIDDIAERFEVSRRTAERMLRALRDRYPELGAEVHHGRKYWRLRGAGRHGGEARADEWTAAGGLVEGLARSLGDPLSALCAACESVEGGEEARHQAERMRRILERSVELFRSEAPKPEPTEAGALLAEVVEAARARARAAGVELSHATTGAQSWFDADRAQLRRALLALVENAIEATPAARRVRVSAAPGLQPGTWRFQVDDEGPGVEAAICERIFEPYFTTRDDAAGLGLALARAIARRHGGRVELQSNAARGASFVLEAASCQGSGTEGPGAVGSPGV